MTQTQLAEKGPPGFNRLLLIQHLFAGSHKEAIAGADRGLQARGLPSWPMINDPGWVGPGPGPEEKGEGAERQGGHRERGVDGQRRREETEGVESGSCIFRGMLNDNNRSGCCD